jgi:hypothetical protein
MLDAAAQKLGGCDPPHYRAHRAGLPLSRAAQRGAGMDQQPKTKIPLWLTTDILLIVVGLILVSLGAWWIHGFQPLNLVAKGPS